jgi:hypothetical protein
MEIRGERECKRCGTQWSYYETGSPECPNCGSVYSVGVGDRTEHTDRPADLDLDGARAALEAGRLAEAGQTAATAAREYVHRRGFIAAGELRPLASRYVLAQEVRQVGQRLRTATPPSPTDVDLGYARRLFEAAETGDLPPAEAVPEAMVGARGLAVAEAVADYRRALRSIQAGQSDLDLERALDRLDSQVRRVRALDGAVEPATADQLLQAARTAGDVVRGEAERTALEAQLDRLGPA